MSKKLVIRFNEKSLHVTHVKVHKDSIQLLNEFTINFNNKILTDKEVNEVDNIAFKLKNELKARKIHTKDVVFTINSSRVLCRKIDIVKQKNEKAFLELLHAKIVADKVFPINLDDHYITYSHIGPHVENESEIVTRIPTDNQDATRTSTPVSNNILEQVIEDVITADDSLDDDDDDFEKINKKDNWLSKLFVKREKTKVNEIEQPEDVVEKQPKEKKPLITLTKDVKAEKIDVMVYVCPQTMIDSITTIADYARLNILNIEYSGNAIHQYVHGRINKSVIDGSPIKSAYFLVHINDVNTIVTVVSGNKITQQKALSLSYSSIASQFFNYSDIFGLETIDDVLEFINANNFLDMNSDIKQMFPNLDDEFFDSPAGQLAMEHIRETQDYVINELLSMIDQLNAMLTQCRTENIRAELIYYYNERSNFPDIVESIVHSTKLPVQAIEPIESFDSLTSYASVLAPVDFSLIINTDKALNQRTNKIILASCFLSVFASLCIVGFYAIKLNEVKLENSRLTRQIDEATDAKQIYTKYTGLKFAYEDLYVLDNGCDNSYLRHFGEILEEIEEIVPVRDLMITYVSAAPNEMTMDVSAARKSIIVKLVQGLESLEFIDDASYIEITDISDDKDATFDSGRLAKATIFISIVTTDNEEMDIEVPDVEINDGKAVDISEDVNADDVNDTAADEDAESIDENLTAEDIDASAENESNEESNEVNE